MRYSYRPDDATEESDDSKDKDARYGKSAAQAQLQLGKHWKGEDEDGGIEDDVQDANGDPGWDSVDAFSLYAGGVPIE